MLRFVVGSPDDRWCLYVLLVVCLMQKSSCQGMWVSIPSSHSLIQFIHHPLSSLFTFTYTQLTTCKRTCYDLPCRRLWGTCCWWPTLLFLPNPMPNAKQSNFLWWLDQGFQLPQLFEIRPHTMVHSFRQSQTGAALPTCWFWLIMMSSALFWSKIT